MRHIEERFREGSGTARNLVRVLVSGDHRLTDIARRRKTPMRVADLAVIFPSQMGEWCMLPRVDKSVTIMTGMIIAAMYIVLLLSSTRESYMRRDADMRFELASARSAPVDVPKQTCRAENPLCIEMFADAGERQQCSAAVDIMRRLLGGPASQLTLEGLRQALRAEP
jgi:hypothetical protein